MINKKMILLDVDGTIMSSEGHFFSNIPVLINSLPNNIQIGLCSARPLFSLIEIARKFNNITYISAFQGTLISMKEHTNEWNIFNRIPIPNVALDDLKLIENRLKVKAWYFSESDWFVSEFNNLAQLEASLLNKEPKNIQYLKLPIYKVLFCLTDQQTKSQKGNLLKQLSLTNLAFAFSKENYLEVWAKHPIQDKGLSVISKASRTPTKLIAAIGDSYNDMGMLRAAGFAITFNESPVAVQQICNKIVKPPSKGGMEIAFRLISKDFFNDH